MEPTILLPHARYAVRLRLGDEAKLPAYLGSTLRGALMSAFRRIACALPRAECGTCLLRTRCAYSYCFETPMLEPDLRMGRIPFAPHPIVMSVPPPQSSPVLREQGAEIDMGFTLIGRANEFLPYFVLALIEMGRRGLGAKRVPCVVEQVSRVGSNGNPNCLVFQQGQDSVDDPGPLQQHFVACALEDELVIEFVTPTLLKSEGAPVREPLFHQLVWAAAWRLSALQRIHYAQGESSQLEHLEELARKVAISQDSTHWHSWQRYSARQGGKHKMQGIVGTVRYQGELGAFGELLAACEALHIGKGTAFGMGQIRLLTGARELN